MLQTIVLFLLILIPSFAKAENVKLLDLPLDDGTRYIFSVNLKKKCSFEGIDKILTPELKQGKKSNWFFEKLNHLQRIINLEIDKKEFNSDSIIFSLKGATNIAFETSIDKSNCALKKTLHLNNKVYSLDEIYIEYSNFLKTPVLKSITIKNNGNHSDLLLYPWALRGQISSYELNIGPALNIHTNIRLNNSNKFEKNNPVIEPIPAFLFRYGPVVINKSGLGSLVYHANEFSLLAMGLIEGEPYLAEGLRERKKGIFLGTILKYNLFELIFYNDFFKNKGYNLKANLAPEFYVNLDWKLTPQIFIQYWDKDYVDYYFGVKPEEINSGMKIFQGHQTINYGAMFEVMHFSGNWTYVLDLGVKSYGKEVYSSPTVVRQNELRFITSVLYKFF